MSRKVDNCHYVTRSITKPWEHKHEKPHKNRELRFYSFEDNSVDYEPSLKLLGEHQLLTDEEETKFSDLIEKPLGHFKARHLKSDSLDNYEIYRSIVMYFMFQTERFKRFSKIESKSLSLSDLLSMPEDELNTLSEGFREKFDLVTMRPVEGHVLFFPEVGYFTFPILCSEEQFAVYAFSLPLYPDLSVCLIPKGPSVEDMEASRNLLMSFSVGVNDNADKILIPQVLDTYTNEQLIKIISEYRGKAVSHSKDCNKLNEKVREMYARSGHNYDEVRLERFEQESFLNKYTQWFKSKEDIKGVLVVGSFAREEQNKDSDLDIMILSDDYENYINNQNWVSNFGDIKSSKVEDWGAVKTVRVFYKNGDEIEFNFSDRTWANINPIDEGTRKVMCDGFKVVYDSQLLLARLIDEL